MDALVSIIIPIYNRAHLITETLDSILAQTYANWECIIVDDGSTDMTLDVVQHYQNLDSRFKCLIRPDYKTKGPSSCRNFGIDNSTGSYIVFLDSDDLLISTCLENRVAFSKQYPEFDFWIFKTEMFAYVIGDLNKIFNITLDKYSNEIYLNLLLQGLYPFCVSSVFWKEEKIKSLKGFDEELTALEDPELHIKAFKNNLNSLTCDFLKSDNFYRKGLQNSSNNNSNKKLLKNTYHLFSLYLKDYPKQMKFHCLDFFRVEVLLKGNLKYFFKFYLLYLNFGILNYGQKIVLPILLLYKVLKIDTIKGFGFYTLTQKYFK
jgi:glycosyltransferase involved in cell wall biosynthesis